MNIEDLPPKYQKQARMKLGDFELDISEPGRPTLVPKQKSVPPLPDVKPSKSKYHAEKTEVDGIIFDSRKEASRYAELMQLERAGVITELKLQPRFTLQEAFVCDGSKYRKIEYVADFMYRQGKRVIVEDTKGVRTDVYKIKRKLFLFRYGKDIEFKEI